MGEEHNKDSGNKDPAVWGVIGLLIVVAVFGVAVQVVSWF